VLDCAIMYILLCWETAYRWYHRCVLSDSPIKIWPFIYGYGNLTFWSTLLAADTGSRVFREVRAYPSNYRASRLVRLKENLPLKNFYIFHSMHYYKRGGAAGWDTGLRDGRWRFRSSMVSLEFFIDIILPAALWPWSRLVSNRNEAQGYVLGAKGSRCVGLTNLALSPVDCRDIWEPHTPGTVTTSPDLYKDCFTFTEHNLIITIQSNKCTHLYCCYNNGTLTTNSCVQLVVPLADLPVRPETFTCRSWCLMW
jgi:hypothetical protein